MWKPIYTLFVCFGLVSNEFSDIIDLTWDFGNDTIAWPGVIPFSFTKIIENDEDRGYWYALKEFQTAEHGGTHLDAPYHFHRQGWKVADIPVDRLIGEGATIDLSRNQTERLEPQHLDQWVKSNGEFPKNTVLLIKFGWSQFWQNRTQYYRLNDEGTMNFPGISPDAAKWIADSGKIVGVGVDTASVDPGNTSDFAVHRVLSKKQIYFMENVKILVDLPDKGFTVVALPMKLRDGTGAPLRVLAVPKNRL